MERPVFAIATLCATAGLVVTLITVRNSIGTSASYKINEIHKTWLQICFAEKPQKASDSNLFSAKYPSLPSQIVQFFPVNRFTHTTENITFPGTTYVVGKYIVGYILRSCSPKHSVPSELRVYPSWHSLHETLPLLEQHSAQLANPPIAVSVQAEENVETFNSIMYLLLLPFKTTVNLE